MKKATSQPQDFWKQAFDEMEESLKAYALQKFVASLDAKKVSSVLKPGR